MAKNNAFRHGPTKQTMPVDRIDPEIAMIGNDGAQGTTPAEALQRSEDKYRSLFENMTEGFALCEMIWDEQGRPSDFRYLEVNEAWVEHTGIPREDAVGRTAREVIPGIESFWIENYAELVRTGASVRLRGSYRQHWSRPQPHIGGGGAADEPTKAADADD